MSFPSGKLQRYLENCADDASYPKQFRSIFIQSLKNLFKNTRRNNISDSQKSFIKKNYDNKYGRSSEKKKRDYIT